MWFCRNRRSRAVWAKAHQYIREAPGADDPDPVFRRAWIEGHLDAQRLVRALRYLARHR